MGLFSVFLNTFTTNCVTTVARKMPIYPSHFVDGTSHGIALTITKLIDFCSQGIFTLLFATVFN